ncbi:MAG: hypothetical protein R3324_14550, partial [Halobacteriales archaeon]|nr:hypothetical protein [Halobacteriales archaeon]
MSEHEFCLQLEPDAPGDERTTERLQREVWDVLMDVFSQYLMEEQGLWPYLRKVTIGGIRQGWWAGDDGALRFRFPDEDGEQRRSAAAFAHWS